MMKQKHRIIMAVVAAGLIVAASATGIHFLLRSASEPLIFSLALSPDNDAVTLGGNTTVTLEAAYLNGTIHPITLSAYGGPNGTTYTFTPQTVEPSKTKAASSNLTINVPAAAINGTYTINVTAATADGKANIKTYSLVVLGDEIYVKGKVTADQWIGVYPTKIAFVNVNTHQVYTAPVEAASGSKSGTYNITVPNHEIYQIICSCNYTPASGHSSYRAFEPMWLTVDCAPGVTTLTKDFTDKDAGFI
ncbi:MAG: hypothetical protein NWE93_12285 [Candidatus Bathyarchaeota archaeon]|nr:hypothetical protein [Candidatus Bathyarchaeota archaeon]